MTSRCQLFVKQDLKNWLLCRVESRGVSQAIKGHEIRVVSVPTTGLVWEAALGDLNPYF